MKKPHFITFAVVAVCVLAALVETWRASSSSYFRGRSIKGYAVRLSSGDPAAGAALKAMGPKAVPVLVDLLEAQDSAGEQFIWSMVKKLPSRLRPKKWDLPMPPTAGWRRSAGARSLAVLGPEAESAIPQLLRGLHDPDFQVRNDVTYTIEKVGKATAPGLARLLEDQDPDVRLRAVTLLGKLGPDAEGALAAVVQRLEDKERAVRIAAETTIGNIGMPSVIALTRVIQRGDTNAQAVAAKFMLQRCARFLAASGSLRKMAAGGTPAVRQQAVEFLGRMRVDDKATIDTLLTALKDPAPEVRAAAAKALDNITWRAQAAVPTLAARLDDESPAVREWSARALGSIGPGAQMAATKLNQLLQEQDASVRGAAREALSQIQTAAPAPVSPP